MTADIFISYKQSERPEVERIAQALRDLGLSVWFDGSVSAGESFSDEIDRHARTAKAVLVCWSPSSVESRWVKSEALIGFEADRLVASQVAGKGTISPPTPFNSVQVADLRSWLAAPSRADVGWRSVLRRLAALCGRSDLEGIDALAGDASPSQRKHRAKANTVTADPHAARRGPAESRPAIVWAIVLSILSALASMVGLLLFESYDPAPASGFIVLALALIFVSSAFCTQATYGKFTILGIVLSYIVSIGVIAMLTAVGGHLWSRFPDNFWHVFENDRYFPRTRWTTNGLALATTWFCFGSAVVTISGTLTGRLVRILLGR